MFLLPQLPCDLDLSEEFDEAVVMVGEVTHVLNGNSFRSVPTKCLENFAEGTFTDLLDYLIILVHVRPAVLNIVGFFHL